MSIILDSLIRILLESLAARLHNKPFDYAAAGYRIISAGRAMVQAESGQPVDDSKIPEFTPIQ